MRTLLFFWGFAFLLLPFLEAEKLTAQTNNSSVVEIIDVDNLKPDDIVKVEIYNIALNDTTVKIFCTVRDMQGRFVTNLAPPYKSNTEKHWKKILEIIGNREYEISDFSVKEIRTEEAPPFITSFVLDYSGSMYADIANVEMALMKVQNYIRPNKDYFNVVQFDQSVHNTVPNTNNVSDLNNIYPFQSLGGLTAFYKASMRGINNIKNVKNMSKVAVLFTDGMDNASFPVMPDDVVINARKHNVKVFVIGYGYASQLILESIAEQTNGKFYYPTDISELDSIFNDIYRQMKVHYVISYKPIKSDVNLHLVNLYFTPREGDTVLAVRKYFKKPQHIDAPVQSNVLALFKSGSSKVDKSFLSYIKQFAVLLKKYKGKISIVGHSDGTGNMASQTELSLKRAWAVYDLLVRNGVDVDQIVSVKGKGHDEPIHKKEEFDWQRFENNRVEILFVSN